MVLSRCAADHTKQTTYLSRLSPRLLPPVPTPARKRERGSITKRRPAVCCVPTMPENSGEKVAGERDREHEVRGRAAANQECVAQIQRSSRAALSVSGPASERAMNFIYHFYQRVQGVVDVEHFYHISKDIHEKALRTPRLKAFHTSCSHLGSLSIKSIQNTYTSRVEDQVSSSCQRCVSS